MNNPIHCSVFFAELPPLEILRDYAVDLGIVPMEHREWIDWKSWNGNEPFKREWTWFVHEGCVYTPHYWTGYIPDGYFAVLVPTAPLGDGRYVHHYPGGPEVYVLGEDGELRPESQHAKYLEWLES